MTPIERVAGISLITPDRLQNLVDALDSTVDVLGDIAELGVYRGGSAYVMAMRSPYRTIHLFDTFQGLPESENETFNPKGHDLSKGRFSADVSEVAELLPITGVEFHIGTFPDSARGLEDLRFSFVHVDCDIYGSAIAACRWFWPRLNPGGVMFFDDYNCEFTGVTQAVMEFFPFFAIVPQTEKSNGIKIGALVRKPL